MQLIHILLLLSASRGAGFPQARTISATAAERSFVLGAYNALDASNALYSMDPDTGKENWVFHPGGEPVPGQPGWAHFWYDTFLKAPTLSPDGATVFVQAGNGYPIDCGGWKGSYALDAQTGAVKWNATETIPPHTDTLHKKSSTSFVVSGDGSTLFQAGRGGAVAFNAADGQKKWAYDINPPAGHGCPGSDCVWNGDPMPTPEKPFSKLGGYGMDQMVPVVSDKHGIFTSMDGNGKLHALQMKDGKKKWEFAVNGGCPIKPDGIFFRGPPCGWIRHTKAMGDVLYVVGYYQKGLHDEDFTSTGTLWALNIKDGTTKWQVALGEIKQSGSNWEFSDPVLNGDGSVVYVIATPGKVYALRSSDGSKIWEAASEDIPTVSPDDRTVYLGFFAGLVSVDAATGKQNWALLNKTNWRDGGWTLLSHSPDGSELFVTKEYQNMADANFYSTLGALNAKDGSVLWTFGPSLGGFYSEAGPNGAISDGTTLQVGLKSPLPGGIGPNPRPNGGSLRTMLVFNLEDRTYKWQKNLPLAGNKYWDFTQTLCPANWHKKDHCKWGGTLVDSRHPPGEFIQCEGLCQTIGGDRMHD